MRSFRLCSCGVVTPKDDPVRLTASRYDFKRMRQTPGIPRREEPTRKPRKKGSTMSVHPDHPAAPQSRPGLKPVANDNLQTLPLAEVEKELGSSPDGLTEAEAKKRLTQYGPNEIAEKKTNELLKFLSYFLGSDPLDDRSGGDPVGGGPPLAGLWHHPPSASR
jgi:hypothetical protein